MKIRTVWIVCAIIFLVLLLAYFLSGGVVQAPVAENPASGAASGQETGSSSQSGTSTQGGEGQTAVNIYLVDVGGGNTGGMGGSFGCGDAVVAVKETVPKTEAVMTAALTKLFSIQDQNVQVGGATYYDALYQSNLKVDSASVADDGVATVKLSGTTQLGGECDDPRVIAQIEKTVMQFSTVKQANIFINNTPLSEYFSLK